MGPTTHRPSAESAARKQAPSGEFPKAAKSVEASLPSSAYPKAAKSVGLPTTDHSAHHEPHGPSALHETQHRARESKGAETLLEVGVGMTARSKAGKAAESALSPHTSTHSSSERQHRARKPQTETLFEA